MKDEELFITDEAQIEFLRKNINKYNAIIMHNIAFMSVNEYEKLNKAYQKQKRNNLLTKLITYLRNR